jgi:hypothetical protein
MTRGEVDEISGHGVSEDTCSALRCVVLVGMLLLFNHTVFTLTRV